MTPPRSQLSGGVFMPMKVQAGAALLLFMLAMITAASAVVLTALNQALKPDGLGLDQRTLQQAREALLGYAMAFDHLQANALPGYLPCPDIDGNGDAEAACGAAGQSAMGFLPWRTLGLPPLRDTSGSCLWYAVSGAYKQSPLGNLSTDASGQFLTVNANLVSQNGANNREAAIALILAPGKALAGQNRAATAAARTECGSINPADAIRQPGNYFESLGGVNNSNGFFAGILSGVAISALPSLGFSAFIAAPVQNNFNDVLSTIRPVDFAPVYQRMQKWVGERVRQCLQAYQAGNGGKLPWPAALNPALPPGFSDNSATLRFGRIANNLPNTLAAGLSANWPADPQQAAVQCFVWPWWGDFRELVFYAIDRSIAPVAAGAPSMTVDGAPATALVLVAGRAQLAQNRVSNADKAAVSNYLEAGNVIDAGTGSIPPGDEGFVTAVNASPPINDYLCTLLSCL